MTDKTLEIINQYNTNGKKTVALFCDVFYPSIDGVISVINNLAIALSKTYNVVVCVPKHKGKTVEKEQYLVLGVNSVKTPGMDYECALLPKADKEFNKYLSALKIDIVHFHSPFFMGKAAVWFAKKNNLPLCASFHSQYKRDFLNTTHSKLLSKMLLKGIMKKFNSADVVFSMNQFCKDLLEEYGAKTKIQLIPNGVNWNNNIPQNRIAEVEQKYGIGPGQMFLIYVGRLVKVKGLSTTIEALKCAKDLGLNFKFLFVGDGSQRVVLEKQAKKLGLENNVAFAGKVMDRELLEAIYARADLFVFNSTYDTDGLVRQEAATKQTPMLCVEGSGAASDIEDGFNGFVAKNTPQDFANRLIELSKNKKLVEQCGKNAQSTLVHSWDEIAKQYSEAYEKLIEQKKNK